MLFLMYLKYESRSLSNVGSFGNTKTMRLSNQKLAIPPRDRRRFPRGRGIWITWAHINRQRCAPRPRLQSFVLCCAKRCKRCKSHRIITPIKSLHHTERATLGPWTFLFILFFIFLHHAKKRKKWEEKKKKKEKSKERLIIKKHVFPCLLLPQENFKMLNLPRKKKNKASMANLSFSLNSHIRAEDWVVFSEDIATRQFKTVYFRGWHLHYSHRY